MTTLPQERGQALKDAIMDILDKTLWAVPGSFEGTAHVRGKRDAVEQLGWLIHRCESEVRREYSY
jgi:hypothetical protein